MTRSLPLSALVAAALALAAAHAASAQQRLYALDNTGQIFEVIGHQTASGALLAVASITLPTATLARGLASDPASGDLFALTLTLPSNTAQILRIDLGAGLVTPVCSFLAPQADGLDRRFDGTLVFEQNLETLVLVDPATCAATPVPTAQPIGVHTSVGSVAFDRRGLVAALGADGTNQRIDPLDGEPFPFAAAVFSGSYSIEVDGNGDVYFGQHDGALFSETATGQLRQILPPTGTALAGLAFTEPADGVGMRVACAGQPNSTGSPSTIEAVGTSIAAGEDLELRSRDLPPHSFGYFLIGPNQGSMPVGAGVLCIAAPQQRYSLFVQDSGAAGSVRFDVDLTALPNGAPVLAGETYLFQYWHRDVGPTSNLSPALRVDFR